MRLQGFAVTIEHVRAGSFFVNEKKAVVREIIAETPDGNVHWRAYHLDDGRPTGDSLVCSKGHVLRWADREATAEEAARMRRDDAETREIAEMKEFAKQILAHVPIEMLPAEFHRCGHDIVGH